MAPLGTDWRSSATWRYGVASAVALGMALFVVLATPYIERHTPILLFAIAVMLAGYLGGTGPALAAVAVCAIAGIHTPTSPVFSIDLARGGPLAHLSMFVIAGTLISFICGTMHRARRRAEAIAEDLERSNRRITDILGSITDCFVALDRDWRIKDINDAAATCLGLQGREVINRPFVDVVQGRECSKCLARYRQALSEQTPLHFETLCHPALGRWMEIHAYPAADGLSIYFRDITQRKHLEQEREHLLATQISATQRVEELAATAELHLSQLQAVINSIDQGLIIGDPQGNILSMNPAALAIHGYESLEEVRQHVKRAADLYEYHDLEGHLLPKEHWPSSRARAGERFSDFEVRVRRKDTGRQWIGSYGGTPIYNRAGELVLTVFTVRDITDAKRKEAELRQAQQDAEAASRAKDQFLAALSHELRTPLTPVLLTLHALAADPQVPDSLRRELLMVGHNVELEARLIDDLLDLTRVAKGKLQLRVEIMDLHALLNHSLRASADSEISRKRLHVALETTATEHYVQADPGRLQQVFWNLLRNAVKFTPADGQIRIRTSNVRPGWICIEVRDTGIGIRPELLPRLFRAFEQGDQSITRRYGGLGLGLAISKSIIELHGGTISATSDGEGCGSVFTIELPACPAPAPDSPPAPNARSQGPSANAPSRKLRILLVEDHEHTAKVLSRLLAGFEHDVITANTVSSAESLAQAHDFDLLISDLGLPDGDGTELMRHLKEKYRLPGIALSGFGMEEDTRRSLDAGFSRHLTKPVNLQQLQAAIDHVAGLACRPQSTPPSTATPGPSE